MVYLWCGCESLYHQYLTWEHRGNGVFYINKYEWHCSEYLYLWIYIYKCAVWYHTGKRIHGFYLGLLCAIDLEIKKYLIKLESTYKMSLKWGITMYDTTLFRPIAKWTTTTHLDSSLGYIHNIITFGPDTLKLLNSLKIAITWRIDRRPTASPVKTPPLDFVDLQCVTLTLKLKKMTINLDSMNKTTLKRGITLDVSTNGSSIAHYYLHIEPRPSCIYAN